MPLGSGSPGARARALVFLTIFCSFVLLGTASADDVADQTDATTTTTTPAADPQDTAPVTQTELQPNPAPSPDDDFGASAALSGNTAAIGSPGANGGTGEVTVWTISGDGTATQQASLTPPDDHPQQGYGTSLSTDGNTLAVGAPGNPFVEGVDVYDLATTALLAQLYGPGSETGFGTAVAVSGDWLAVGAPQSVVCDDFYEEECDPSGTVLMFHREEGVWVQFPSQVLLGAPSSAFGSSLALDGLTLVVGAPNETIYPDSAPYGLQAGAAHVYTLVEGEGGYQYWSEVGSLTDPNAIYGGGFGTAVAVDGAKIAVGAPNPSADGDPGKVVVFTDPFSEGSETQTIGGPADGYLFGHSLALDGGNLAIGYYQSDFSGAVDLYTQGGSTETNSASPNVAGDPFTYQSTQHGSGAGDNYGQSLALSGGNLLVGGGGHAYLVGRTSGGGSGGGGGTAGSGGNGGTAGLSGSNPDVGTSHSPARNDGGGGAAAAAEPVTTVRVTPHVSKPRPAEAEPKRAERSKEAVAEEPGAEAAESDRSSFADRVLSPAQVDFSFTNLAEGGLLAFILAALLYLPVTIFNKATERNHETIAGWFAGPRRRMEAIAERIPFGRHPLALLISTGVVSGLLFSFVEPGFPGRAGSLQYLTGMVLGFVFVAIIFFGTWREVVHRLEPESEGRWRLYPPYILLAIGLVAVARLAHFLPGVVLGTLAEYEPGKRMSKRTAGLRVLITYSLLLVVGFAAWFAWIPVEQAAKEPGATSLTLILDAALSVIFVTGLESAVFGLIPLKFLDGNDLWNWKKGLWAILWGIGVYWFAVVILHPALTTYNEESSAGAFWFGILFGALMIVALSTWAFFTIREARLRARSEGAGTS